MSSNPEHCASSTTTSEGNLCRYWKGCCSGRVRDLAKRFEQSTVTHVRNQNSFSKSSRKRFYQNCEKRGRCPLWPPQKPVRHRLGIYRKRSSMKKRSQSYLDMPVISSSHDSNSCSTSLHKSRSNDVELCDQADLLTIKDDQERETDRRQKLSDCASTECMQLRDDNADSECQESAMLPSSITDSNFIADETSHQNRSISIDAKSKSKSSVKPVPPAKPARFKKKLANSTLLKSATDRPTLPPPVLPKSVECLRIMEEAVLRHKAEEESEWNDDVTAFKDAHDKTEQFDVYSLSKGDEAQRYSAAATSSKYITLEECPECPLTAINLENNKPVEERSTKISNIVESTCTLPRTKTSAKGVLRRSTYLHDGIKKPTIQPPPPPLPAVSSRVRCAAAQQKQHTLRITHCSNEVTHIEVPSSSQTNCVQCSSSQVEPLNMNEIHGLSATADAKITEIPRVPSIPPPEPPKSTLPHSVEDDELYEEIEQVISIPETSTSDFDERRSLDSQKASPYASASCIGSYTPNSNTHSDGSYSDFTNTLSRHFIKALKIRDDTKAEKKKKHSFRTLRLRRRSSNVKRPMSTLEFDKLLRIKSDIQLNISRKVGQIKLKVTSLSQDKDRKGKSNSTFYVSPEELKAELNFPLDDNYIYGDDWSTDDDEDVSTEEVNNGTINGPQCFSTTNTVPSMLYEIEEELKRKIASSTLTDSVSVDKTDANCANSTAAESQSVKDTNCKSFEVYSEDDDATDEVTNQIPTVNSPIATEQNPSSKPPANDYQQIELPTSSTSDKVYELQNSRSDSILNNSQYSLYTPRFIPEPQPLYQIYMMEQQESMMYNGHENDEGVMLMNESVEKELKVRRNSSSASTDSGRGADCSTTVSHITSNTSMRRDRLVAASHFGSQRSLWCELPEVKNAGLLDVLDEDMKKLQEAFFEVITSEASYLRSLNILITHFMAAPELLGSKGTSSVISNEERKQLFSNIFAVRDCSERLLSDLESRLEANLVLTDVCDILCEHFSKNFEPYVMYCSNQVYQDRTLKRLKCENTSFMSCIQRLESDRQCQGLDMRSFLMLPMQRVTRYPLLVIAILDRIGTGTEQQKTAQSALHLANQVVINCNEGARRMERTEQLLEIERRLVYKSSDLRRIPLVSSGRYLVKRGSLMHLTETKPKTILQSRQQTHNLYLFLFSDILMITKKKLNGSYVCKDYAARKFVDIEPVEIDSSKVSQAAIANLTTKPHLFICTLMHNARSRQAELLLNAESESDRERWLSALRPPTCSNPEEKIYADWDCPQATVVHTYTASQEDELSLEKGDLINILRKMPDGWFYGERVRDSKGGWFPSSYVQQVLNDHVRAKNYRQRLRVIQAAADYRYQQEQLKNPDTSSRRTPHLIDRFRRLSNPKGFFHPGRSLD